MSSNENKRSRKILIPLATMSVAAAVMIGSGATWTSESKSSVSVTAGNVSHTNDRNGATLTIKNLKPGDVSTGELTITNDGSLDSKLSFAETVSTNTFGKSADGENDLHLVMERDGVEIFDGAFGALSTTPIDITGNDPLTGRTDAETDTTVISFEVTLDEEAVDASEGASASATYRFVTSPVGGGSDFLSEWIN